jgi:hypothetical protein
VVNVVPMFGMRTLTDTWRDGCLLDLMGFKALA